MAENPDSSIELVDKWVSLIPGYDPYILAGDCYLDHDAAIFAIEFVQQCIKHVKGVKGCPAGNPFLLEPWEKAVVSNLFGWKRPDGFRRYRECLIYVPKKNGKTALAAAILLLVMMTDDEMGAELYSAASSRDQAAFNAQFIITTAPNGEIAGGDRDVPALQGACDSSQVGSLSRGGLGERSSRVWTLDGWA